MNEPKLPDTRTASHDELISYAEQVGKATPNAEYAAQAGSLRALVTILCIERDALRREIADLRARTKEHA